MNKPSDNARVVSAGIEAILTETSLRPSIVSEARERWAQGERPDARVFLADHPEYGTRKSIVLDLAYEEYCQKTEAGESIDVGVFCRRFPTFEKSLGRLLAVHEFLDENVHLLPVEDYEWVEPGQTFLGFFILAELGRGAFARVFLAEETALGNRPVAIKVGRDGAGEAAFLGKLRHSNIVPVHSVRRDAKSSLTAVCMPYLGRTTLCDVLGTLFAREKIPTRSREILQAVNVNEDGPAAGQTDGCQTACRLRSGSYVDGAIHLGTQLADALAYSHSKGICHSDLKPSNILITPDGTPMLLDFNLAFDAQAAKRRLGGTLPYMAPEQLRAVGEPSGRLQPAVDERSDIFSLGVILYEMLSGRLPFGPLPTGCCNDEIGSHLLKRQRSGPSCLREANSQVDPALAELVESCLAFEPQDRPESADALGASLRRTVSPARRARRWMGQRRWLIRSIAASFLVICLGVSYHLSTRDTYAVRQLNAGRQCYSQGEYAEAEKYFGLASEWAETRAEALFWRGRARQKAGDVLLALKDYDASVKLQPAPEIDACRAYCWALEGQYESAIFSSQKAIDGGFASAEVYNILGYCYERKNIFQSAMDAFDEAIRLDGSLQAASYHRAMIELRLAIKAPRPLDKRAATDIDNAIDAGPLSAGLYLDAARVYSKLGQESGEYREQVVRYLAEALRLGVNSDHVRQEFESLLDDPAIEAAFENGVPGAARDGPTRLVDPLTSDSLKF